MSETVELPPPEGEEGSPPENFLLRAADTVFGIVAGLTILAMVIMTSADVVGRYILGAPLGFAYEMTQMGMALVVLAALPSVTLRGQHVTVGLFENALSGRAKFARDAAIASVIGLCCLFLSWRLSTLAGRFMSYGEVTSVLALPIGIVAWIGVATLVAAAIAAATVVVRALSAMVRGEAR